MNLNLLGGQDRIEGWKAIASEIGVSETRARHLANPNRRWPLPVRYGARGFYVVREMLAVWFQHFDAPFGAHQELKQERSEPQTLVAVKKRAERLRKPQQRRT